MSQSVVPSSSLRCWMTCLILCIVSLHPCNLWKTNQYSKMRSDYEHNLCWNHLIIFFVTCWYCSISSKLGNKTKFLIINQLDAPISQIYLGMNLYVFQTVPLSIIRSFFTVHTALVYVIQVCWQLASRIRMELQFILEMNLYMFRTVPLSIIRSFSL